MKISTIGEQGLVDRIRHLLPPSPDVPVGVGDDCAVFKPTAGTELLLTTDILVDQVDFTLQTITPFRLGRKAMGVNLSDIAAMGGLPRAALVALSIPGEADIEFVEELYRGLLHEGFHYGVGIIGGDLSASSTVTIGVTLVGEVETGRALTRAGAKPGDQIWITGRLGGSRAGLSALRAGFRLRDDRVVAPSSASSDLRDAVRSALERHFCPVARVRQGRALAMAGVASAMIDLSDGLAADLGHLCRESGVSARIREDRIPVDPAASLIGRHLGEDPMGMALSGGEDFELLFTSSSNHSDIVQLFDAEAFATEIGKIEEGGQGCLLVLRSGSTVPLTGGFDHFRSSER